MNAALLVIDHPDPRQEKLYAGLDRVFKAITIQGTPLRVAAFVDDPEGRIETYVKKRWQGEVVFLDTAKLMQEQGMAIRAEIVEFVEQVRERLVELVRIHGGQTWAERFQNLWWYTELSEKNSPGNPIWWHLFRGKLISRLLSGEHKYHTCAVVGSAELGNIIGQVCAPAGVLYKSVPITAWSSVVLRAVFTRIWGAVCHIFAVAAARIYFGGKYVREFIGQTAKAKIFLYTWFPRVWTTREGRWQDMYWGETVDWFVQSQTVEPFFVARMYDRPDFVPPATYLKRVRMFQDEKLRPYRGLVLEAFITPGKVLRIYSRLTDIFRYFRLTKNKEFKKVFDEQGISFYKICVSRLTRSVLVHWPHLEILEVCAKNLARIYTPRAVGVYCFEYMYGRALIKGTKLGAPEAKVVGVQHGPITWMKWLYAGFGSVDKKYQPDRYALDGPLAAEILREGGVDQYDIRIIGPARFDRVWARARVGVHEGERTKVLVAPGLHDTQFMLTFVFKALLQDPQLHLIVKKHPKVPLSSVEALVQSLRSVAEGSGATVEIVREGNIYSWMDKADLFLSTYSSTGVEAVAFGIPVILLTSKRTPDMSLFYNVNSPVLVAYDVEGLNAHVNKLVEDSQSRVSYTHALQEVVSKSFDVLDSQASKRLAELCAKV